MLYLSPLQQEKSFDNTINDVKSEKNFKYTQSFNNIKDPNSKKFSTPYRRININQKKDRISPSAKVIIKNFNYNNVYNINIDNDKEQKSKDKNLYNNKNHKNKELNRFTHKYITYNKPKTTSNLTIKCIISKKGEKNNYNDAINNDSNYRKGTFYSRFITEGNYLKNEKDNFVINASSNSRNKKLNEENNLYQKNNIKANDTNSNLSNKSNSYSIKTFRLDKSNSTHKLSLNNNVYLKNIPNTPKPFSPYLKTEKIIDNFSVISFNLNDLNIFDDKLNQIIYKLKNKTSTNIEIYNECYEFIKFYSNSTIKCIFTTYFKDNNKLIIESSINLSLFSIIIIYHLSKNNLLMKNIFQIVDYILFLLKINFTLYIKKLQLYYNINISNKNYIYFKSYNNFLNDNNITNAENEVDITFRIYQNCKQMTNNMKLIMEYYKKINTIYYNNFVKIFNNISMHNEEELFNYFFTKILKMKTIKKLTQTYKSTEKDNKNNNKNNLLNINYRLKRNKTNENFGYFSPGKKKSIFENLSIKRGNYKINKQLISSTERLKNIALKEKMKKIWGKGGKVGYGIGIPYIREQTSKKYTLILDLNKTLGYYNEEGKVILRNGLFSFLDSIKPFYELISFCGEQKYIADGIIKEIEKEKKYFDYNLNRDNCIIYENNLVKDISFIGRDMTKIIVVDDDENCFKLNKENAIKISTFNGYNNKDKNNKNNANKLLLNNFYKWYNKINPNKLNLLDYIKPLIKYKILEKLFRRIKKILFNNFLSKLSKTKLKNNEKKLLNIHNVLNRTFSHYKKLYFKDFILKINMKQNITTNIIINKKVIKVQRNKTKKLLKKYFKIWNNLIWLKNILKKLKLKKNNNNFNNNNNNNLNKNNNNLLVISNKNFDLLTNKKNNNNNNFFVEQTENFDLNFSNISSFTIDENNNDKNINTSMSIIDKIKKNNIKFNNKLNSSLKLKKNDLSNNIKQLLNVYYLMLMKKKFYFWKNANDLFLIRKKMLKNYKKIYEDENGEYYEVDDDDGDLYKNINISENNSSSDWGDSNEENEDNEDVNKNNKDNYEIKEKKKRKKKKKK